MRFTASEDKQGYRARVKALRIGYTSWAESLICRVSQRYPRRKKRFDRDLRLVAHPILVVLERIDIFTSFRKLGEGPIDDNVPIEMARDHHKIQESWIPGIQESHVSPLPQQQQRSMLCNKCLRHANLGILQPHA